MNTLNLDPAEIHKFDALAEDWWNPTGQFRTLHDINPLRLNYIHQHAPLAGKTVLDIGCGGGILSESMAALGAHVTAIDMSSAALEVARQHAKRSGLNIDYRCVTIEDLSHDSPASYEIVTCMEMLEHVPDPVSIVTACAKACTPGGHIFFSTLNRNLKSFAFAIVAAEYLLNLIPKGTHDYAKFIKPAELAAWSRQAGLELHDIRGIQYQPFAHSINTSRYRLRKHVDINYLMHCSKPV